MRSSLFLLGILTVSSCYAQTPACSNSTINGAYFYELSGTIANQFQTFQYAELGKLTVDGQGAVTGESTASTDGQLSTFSLAGTYSIQGNCTGTMNLTLNGAFTEILAFQVVNGGQGFTLSFASAGGVLTGRAERAANSGRCNNSSLSGNYGLVLAGKTVSVVFSDNGQIIADGNGAILTKGFQNFGGGGAAIDGTGSYAIAADCSGTLQISNASGIAHYALAISDGPNIRFLQTDAGTLITGSARLQQNVSLLPQFTFGGSWYTALYFTNNNDISVTFTVDFISNFGAPLFVPAFGSTSKEVTLAAHGTVMLEAPIAGPTQIEGYASVALPVGVTGYGIFRQVIQGRPTQEAVALLTSATATSSTLTFDDAGLVTAVAIANPSDVATIVSILAKDESGQDIASGLLLLAAKNKTAVVLRDLPGLSGIAGKRGSVQFSVSTGNVAVLGIRFVDAAFSSIPTTQQ